MNKKQYHFIVEAMLSLSRMIASEHKWQHGDCESVAPTLNICPTCPQHSYCHARQDFKFLIGTLESLGEG